MLFTFIMVLFSQFVLIQHGEAGQVESTPLIFFVSRDTFVSSVKGEKNGNNGSAKRLKVKGPQEYTLFDVNLESLRGKIISRAVLHVRSASPENSPLRRVSISTVASEWVEGSGSGYEKETGSSSFTQAAFKQRNWSYQGSTVIDVVLGRGHTLWKFADCASPDKQGWQACVIDPDVVAARVAGLSYGFFMYDDVGTTWSIKNGEFQEKIFPNRFFYSREKKSSGPSLEVELMGRDEIPPDIVEDIQVVTTDLPPGQAVVSWKTPIDRGGGKVLGYMVTYKRHGGALTSFPRYLIPMAGKVGDRVKMHIRDLPFLPGEQLAISISAVDSAGNRGPAEVHYIKLSKSPLAVELAPMDLQKFSLEKQLPAVNGLRVSVVDLLDKINPVTGEIIPEHYPGYKGGNHLFSAKEKLVRLQGAKNETIAFQVNVEGQAENISINLRFDNAPLLQSKLFQFAYVGIGEKKLWWQTFLPDPLVPLLGRTFSVPSGKGQVQVVRQKNLSLICEIYIPHDTPPGEKSATLVVASGGDVLKFNVQLKVWDFTLPNVLSFVPELNAYSTVSPFKGYEYYRLAHEHRTCLNRLPYGWDGRPAFAPVWNSETGEFAWGEWDRKVGPLLDGTAFADLPRSGEPVDVFYLPVNENWPIAIAGHYTPSYWAEDAFDKVYEADLKAALTKFADHCSRQRWGKSRFQFYLNNKVGYRKKNPKSSAPWNFDEPIDTKDFWALRWYGSLFQSAMADSRKNSEFWYRADISYTQFGRNILSGITDIEYIGGNNHQKTRQKHDEDVLYSDSYFAEYGNVNLIEEANTRAVAWCLSAWSNGAVGVLPWQAIGSGQSWIRGEQTALIYPSAQGPIPSVRLKALTRGQQDVEYLEIFRKAYALPRWQVVDLLTSELKQQSKYEGFAGVQPGALWQLRYKMGEMISKKHPKYQRTLIDRTKPVRQPGILPDIGYVRGEKSFVKRVVPKCDSSCFGTH